MQEAGGGGGGGAAPGAKARALRLHIVVQFHALALWAEHALHHLLELGRHRARPRGLHISKISSATQAFPSCSS